MRPTELAKPLGVFVLVIAVVLGGTAVLAAATGSGGGSAPDGQNIQGQSPEQFQPESVDIDADPETGELDVRAPEGSKRILVDTGHSNQFQERDIEPVVEALSAAGHDVDVGVSSSGSSFGGGGYNATLQEYDALIVIAPQEGFTDGQRTAIGKYTEGDGRVLVLGEPTQPDAVQGSLSYTLGYTGFGANDLTTEFDARIGSELLYSLDDEDTDNNFMSVNAEPATDDDLTAGVDTITFERAGYVIPVGDEDADVLYTAADSARTYETERDGARPVVVRNDNVVVVADSDILTTSELYDADNEVFVSNALNFLVSGDKPDDVPATSGEDDDF